MSRTSPIASAPTPAARTVATRPRRWKMWVLLTCTIYPLLLLIATLTDPLVHALPPAARFLVVVPLMTASVVWFVLPQIHRVFGPWLTR
jgi:antibiotic biosynthesis monooxygenase (ABM) superfamily enzyme